MGLSYHTCGETVRAASFVPESGGCTEWYLTVSSSAAPTIEQELAVMGEDFDRALDTFGLTAGDCVFTKVHMSDAANQAPLVRKSSLYEAVSAGGVSMIQQRPLPGHNFALQAYLVKGGGPRKRETFTVADSPGCNALLLHGADYAHLWFAQGTAPTGGDAAEQTEHVFGTFDSLLKRQGMNLLDNTVRTWLFVRDIDNRYDGMVRARKAFFEHNGLTTDTRYIASTGIEGATGDPRALVTLDAYAAGPLKPGQMTAMHAPEHMPPTISYGVTFERGTRVRYGDRSHVYISGTASIDRDGAVVHSSAEPQARRTVENIRALLASENAGLDDLACCTVYVRNPNDRAPVMEVVAEELPEGLPMTVVEGAVCRPAWLVEMEGIAVVPDRTSFPPFG